MSRFLETVVDMNMNYTAAGYSLKTHSVGQNFSLCYSAIFTAIFPQLSYQNTTVKIGGPIQEPKHPHLCHFKCPE